MVAAGFSSRGSSGRRGASPSPRLCQNQLPERGPSGVIIPTVHRSRLDCQNSGRIRGNRRDAHEHSSSDGALCFSQYANGPQGGGSPELSLSGIGGTYSAAGASSSNSTGAVCFHVSPTSRRSTWAARWAAPLTTTTRGTQLHRADPATNRTSVPPANDPRAASIGHRNVGITSAADPGGALGTQPTTPATP